MRRTKRANEGPERATCQGERIGAEGDEYVDEHTNDTPANNRAPARDGVGAAESAFAPSEGLKGLRPNIFSHATTLFAIPIPDRLCGGVCVNPVDLFSTTNPSLPSPSSDSRRLTRPWVVKGFVAEAPRASEPFTPGGRYGLA